MLSSIDDKEAASMISLQYDYLHKTCIMKSPSWPANVDMDCHKALPLDKELQSMAAEREESDFFRYKKIQKNMHTHFSNNNKEEVMKLKGNIQGVREGRRRNENDVNITIMKISKHF